DAARIESGTAHGQLHRALRHRQQPQADRRGAGQGMSAARARPASALRDFLQGEAAGGVILMAAAALAMLVANLPALSDRYFDFLHLVTGPVISPQYGPMTVHLW